MCFVSNAGSAVGVFCVRPTVSVRRRPPRARGISIALALLLWCACAGQPAAEAPHSAGEADPILLASQKAAKSLAWYTLDGELLMEVAVSDHPHEFARSADGSRLYVTDNGVMRIENAGEGGNKVSIIDIEARKRIGEVDLGHWHRPHGIDVCVDGTLLVTTENPDQLLVIDLEQRIVTKSYPTGGRTPHIVQCSPDATTAYVSNARSRTVAKIDIASGERELLETGDRPEGSALNRDGSKLYVAHREADKIVVIDTDRWAVLGEIATPGAPVRCGLAGDDKTLAYGLIAGAIGFADVESMQEVSRLELVGPAVSLEMHDDVTALTCVQERDTCYVVSVPERSILHTVKVREGAGPDPALLLD